MSSVRSVKLPASSRDIVRRHFLTEMAPHSITQKWARHTDPRTTSQFYVRHEAEELATVGGGWC